MTYTPTGQELIEMGFEEIEPKVFALELIEHTFINFHTELGWQFEWLGDFYPENQEDLKAIVRMFKQNNRFIVPTDSILLNK